MNKQQTLNDYQSLKKSYNVSLDLLIDRVALLRKADRPDKIRIDFLLKEIKLTENIIIKIHQYIETTRQGGEEI